MATTELSRSSMANVITLENFLRLPRYFAQGIKYHAAGHIYTPRPVYAALHVTRRCNARCIMCSDWKKQNSDEEMSLTEIKETFGNPLFSSLEKFALTGGEAKIKENLAEIAQTVLESCPQIKEMSLRRKLSKIADYLEENKICNKDELRGVRSLVNKRNHVLSVDSLNAYVHNKDYNPAPSDIKSSWDNIQIFMQKLWTV